ncbi:MAG: sensor histidine kinase [bacterium]
MIHEHRKGHRILIVDDVVHNIQVLITILQEAGYELGFAKDGKTALAHIDAIQFDLILLDIMMPGIDGYEVCSRLKKDKNKKDIPIIFITAMNDIDAKTKGFELGAVDYITKPFDAKEVLARVKTHLTIRDYATNLEQMVEERTSQLFHAERLATLGTFSSAIVHEINNPLSYIMSNIKLLKLFWDSAKPIMARYVQKEGDSQLEKDAKDVDEWLSYAMDGSYRISKLVNSLKTYSRQSITSKEIIPLADILDDARHIVHHKLKFYSIHIESNIAPDLALYCDKQKISQVLVNLLNNACDAMADKGGTIYIRALLAGNQIEIRIRDTGPGIAHDIAPLIFDPFFTTKGKDQGTGLGLFIVRTIIEEHGGTISLVPSEGEGAEFKLIFPLAPHTL